MESAWRDAGPMQGPRPMGPGMGAAMQLGQNLDLRKFSIPKAVVKLWIPKAVGRSDQFRQHMEAAGPMASESDSPWIRERERL